MELVYLLLPTSIMLACLALWGFVWAVRKGQMDDLDTPAQRILFDDDEKKVDSKKK